MKKMDFASSQPTQPSNGPAQESVLESNPSQASALFAESVSIMARLRAPDGCAWDQAQSFDSIRKYTLEETYEVFDAIERRDFPHLAEELGDLLLQVLFYAEMAANEGHFTIAEVLDHLNRKLIRRHPHVFGEEASRAAGNTAFIDPSAESPEKVLRNWEEIKAAERAAKSAIESSPKSEPHEVQSRLNEVPRALPALSEAAKLGSKAAKSGFDWPDWRGLLPKLAEETAELEAAVARPWDKPAIQAELGDILFTAVNLARHLHVDPEIALRDCNLRFRRRFSEMERSSGKPLEELSPAELEQLWINAKQTLASHQQEP